MQKTSVVENTGPLLGRANRSPRNTVVSGKRSFITLLVLVNLLLLAALLIGSYPPATAFAQVAARSGQFVSVTAKAAGQTYDVVYVLDVPERKLYAFHPSPTQRDRLIPTAPRDLAQDFQRQ